jgi:hypothetical protein
LLKTAGIDPTATSIPEVSELNALPDRLFAFVATNGPNEVIRKYAMHDRDSLVLSEHYFLEHKGSIPEQLHSKIAANLVNACAWYDVTPSEELVKIALLGAAMTALDAANPVSTEGTRHKQDMSRFRAAQSAGAKVADLNGTDAMPLSGPQRTRSPSTMPVTTNSKTAWHHCGDVAGLEIARKKVAAENTHWAFPDKRYPITTGEQVKRAMQFFDDHASELAPIERRIFAQSVCQRADELGVKVAGRIEKYAGDTYGPHFDTELKARMQTFADRPVGEQYQTFYEKRAEMAPDLMAAAVTMLDTLAFPRGMGNFRDAYAAVFDGSIKTAGIAKPPDFEMFQVGPDTVSTEDLARLAGRFQKLDALFGAGFGLKFLGDPKKVFLGLPDGQKTILARLARSAP